MEDQAKHTLQGPHWQPRLADTLPDFTPLRLVVDGGEAEILVDKPEMVAGRHSEADLPLRLPDVSRRHCRFHWTDGHWQISDLGSLNGVWVNDHQVQQANLEEGDRVRIGGFAFIVHLAVEVVAKERPSLFNLLRMLRPAEQAPRRLAS